MLCFFRALPYRVGVSAFGVWLQACVVVVDLQSVEEIAAAFLRAKDGIEVSDSRQDVALRVINSQKIPDS